MQKMQETWVWSLGQEDPLEKEMQTHSSTLPGKFHGLRNLVGCSPWGHEESDTTEQLHFHFSLSYIGEGNGNSLQCSCLENPRDRGAWWAAVHGVAQCRTRLKWLSSSSSSLKTHLEFWRKKAIEVVSIDTWSRCLFLFHHESSPDDQYGSCAKLGSYW